MKDRQHRRRRKNRFDEQFVGRTIRMLESPPYRVLSLAGHRVLARLEIELARHGGFENGKLPVTHEQFIAYGVRKDTVSVAIREVEKLGFVEVTDSGQGGNREFRRPAAFRLTYLPAGGAKPTHEWQHIETRAVARDLARAARPKNRKSPPKSCPFHPTNRGATIDAFHPTNRGVVSPHDSGGTSRISAVSRAAQSASARVAPPQQSAARALSGAPRALRGSGGKAPWRNDTF
jgi:hypothetical protein